MTKTITWAITQAALVAVVWAGYIEGIQGAEYLFMFYVFAFGLPVLAIALFAGQVQRSLSEDPQGQFSGFKRTATVVIDIAILVVVAWSGSFVTAVAWAVLAMACEVLTRVVDRLRQERAQDAAQRLSRLNETVGILSGKAHPFRFKDQT